MEILPTTPVDHIKNEFDDEHEKLYVTINKFDDHLIILLSDDENQYNRDANTRITIAMSNSKAKELGDKICDEFGLSRECRKTKQ